MTQHMTPDEYHKAMQELRDGTYNPDNPPRGHDESDLQTKVIQLAVIHGWLHYHTHDSRRSAPGFPDLVLVRPPRIVFAELKTTRGTLTGPQDMWMAKLKEAAGANPHVEVYLWRPSHLPDPINRILT